MKGREMTDATAIVITGDAARQAVEYFARYYGDIRKIAITPPNGDGTALFSVNDAPGIAVPVTDNAADPVARIMELRDAYARSRQLQPSEFHELMGLLEPAYQKLSQE